ncbi:hypothetical protein EL17_23090 [Anditalea andensis]|uniref:Uncharacterized protein n=1 Tax=Anditalea andensis TaxID=1048983 RepID=A0A074LPP0_9BACT|nr:hypothetical protein EL17_23090 [Anditalea andensis]
MVSSFKHAGPKDLFYFISDSFFYLLPAIVCSHLNFKSRPRNIVATPTKNIFLKKTLILVTLKAN